MIDPVGLLEACDDPDAFGIELWPKQREILAAIEAGPRLQILCLGRRSSKTTMGALVAVHACLFRPDLDARVRRGESRHVVGVATRLDQSRIFLHAARSVVENSPLLSGLVEGTTEDSITFKNGVRLVAFPATSRGARGWPISHLLFDEAAHMLETDGDQSAESLFRSLASSTLQFGSDARIVIASTPFGEGGWFAEMFMRAQSGELAEAAVHHFASTEVNPTLDAAVLEQERLRDPDGYRGEILAQFLGSGNAYIDQDRLRNAVADRGELSRGEGRDWVIGLDLGFASDPTGLVAVCRDVENPQRLRVGLSRAWAPHRARTFEERRAIEDRLLDDVADLAHHFDARVIGDQHFAPQVRDHLQRRGVSVSTLGLTAETKSLAFTEMRARIYAETLELYPSDGLLAELRQLRTQFLAGKSSVITPRTSKGHSDQAVALSLAVWAHDRSGLGLHGTPVGGGDNMAQAARLLGERPARREWGDTPTDLRRMLF